MALRHLKTNLRSLKFGLGQASDKPGGGYSNQPYIVKPIPDYDDDGSNVFNTGGPDSLLRGGLMAPIKSINDVSRLAQMFFDLKSPNGLLFIAKQNVLSRTSVKTEASIGPGTAGGTVNQGVYLPSSTLAQAAVGFTGTHLNLLGLNPASPGKNNDSLTGQLAAGGLVKYETAVKTNSENIGDNRLIKLTNEKLGFIADASEEEDGFFSRLATKIGIGGPLDPILQEYNGGPGSVLGIGKTKIFFSDQRTGGANPLSVSNPGYFYKGGTANSLQTSIKGGTESPKYKIGALGDAPTNEENNNPQFEGKTLGVSRTYNKLIAGVENNNSTINNDKFLSDGYFFSVYEPIIEGNTWPTNTPLQKANNSLTWNQDEIISQPVNAGKLSGNPEIQDFRRKLVGTPSNPTIEKSTITSLAPNYNGENSKNIENRVNLGDPGKTPNLEGTGVLKYSVNGLPLDTINAKAFTKGGTPDHGASGNDLCKFSIGILNNDGTGISNYINFRALINSFDDKYNAEWGEVQYVGRADKFYNYKGFSRSISMGWTVYAQSKAELIPMYKKLNYLATGLAPTYSMGGYMQGNLARLTVGGYLYNQLGIIKSITYTIPTESTWEIGINEFGEYDPSVKELPHMINVTGFEFIPIQSEATQKGRTRFIMLSNGGNTNWSKDTNGITGMPPPIQPAPVAKEKQEEENTISE